MRTSVRRTLGGLAALALVAAGAGCSACSRPDPILDAGPIEPSPPPESPALQLRPVAARPGNTELVAVPGRVLLLTSTAIFEGGADGTFARLPALPPHTLDSIRMDTRAWPKLRVSFEDRQGPIDALRLHYGPAIERKSVELRDGKTWVPYETKRIEAHHHVPWRGGLAYLQYKDYKVSLAFDGAGWTPPAYPEGHLPHALVGSEKVLVALATYSPVDAGPDVEAEHRLLVVRGDEPPSVVRTPKPGASLDAIVAGERVYVMSRTYDPVVGLDARWWTLEGAHLAPVTLPDKVVRLGEGRYGHGPFFAGASDGAFWCAWATDDDVGVARRDPATGAWTELDTRGVGEGTWVRAVRPHWNLEQFPERYAASYPHLRPDQASGGALAFERISTPMLIGFALGASDRPWLVVRRDRYDFVITMAPPKLVVDLPSPGDELAALVDPARPVGPDCRGFFVQLALAQPGRGIANATEIVARARTKLPANRTVIRGRYGNASTIGVWVDGTYEVAAQLSEELATNPASPPPVICAPPLLDQVYLDEPDAGSPTP